MLCLFFAAEISLAQNVVEIGDPASFGRAKDLTKTLETDCNRVIKHKLGTDVTLEIWYDRHSTNLVHQMERHLIASFSQTMELIKPLGSEIIRIYVARIERLPAAYQVASPSKKTFVWPVLYDSDTDLSLECESITKLCETIYTMLPHELTHDANDGKFASSATWMGEGLAEYVSGQVGQKLSQRQAYKREMETLPEVSLNSNRIRQRILDWSYNAETLTEESSLYYGASHQLLRLIVSEAEKLGEKQALKKILVAIRGHSGSLGSKEVIAILRDVLMVDVTKLGELNPNRRREILEKARDTYLRERFNKKTGYRYTSLNTFAHLNETLPDQFLAALVEEVFDEKNLPLFQRLAASALLLRVDQQTFNRIKASTALRRTKLSKYDSHDAFRQLLLTLCGTYC